MEWLSIAAALWLSLGITRYVIIRPALMQQAGQILWMAKDVGMSRQEAEQVGIVTASETFAKIWPTAVLTVAVMPISIGKQGLDFFKEPTPEEYTTMSVELFERLMNGHPIGRERLRAHQEAVQRHEEQATRH